MTFNVNLGFGSGARPVGFDPSLTVGYGEKVCDTGWQQAAAPATNRQKLEGALAYLEDWLARVPIGTTVHLVRHPNCLPGKNYGPQMAAVLDAARKHLDTLPKPPQFVDTWHVEYIYSGQPYLNMFRDYQRALSHAAMKRARGRQFVTVTGPHERQVPA